MDNKIMIFVDANKEKKSIWSKVKEHQFLHFISKIQDDLPMNTYFIELNRWSNYCVVC